MSLETMVYIVDDDEAVRSAITDLVEDMGCNASPHPSAEDFLESVSGGVKGDCLVLDVRMAGMSGMDLLTKLHQDNVVLPVILVTGHGDIPMTVDALKKGAIDVLEKPFREHVLWEKIKNAIAVGKKQSELQRRREQFLQRFSKLSGKEHRVVKFLLRGKNDKQISNEVDVTRRAIAFQRTSAMKKLQVSNVVELAGIISELNIEV